MAKREYTIIEYEKFRFSQVREVVKLAICSLSRGGVNNEHFETVFGLQSRILEYETIHFEIICKHKPKNRAGKSENWAKL